MNNERQLKFVGHHTRSEQQMNLIIYVKIERAEAEVGIITCEDSLRPLLRRSDPSRVRMWKRPQSQDREGVQSRELDLVLERERGGQRKTPNKGVADGNRFHQR